ncbi:MAG: hypothetical protein ACJAV2_002778 [Myxococcota bacterium]|jgi:hypothetical protein
MVDSQLMQDSPSNQVAAAISRVCDEGFLSSDE